MKNGNGLQQDVADALSSIEQEASPALPPVDLSNSAIKVLSGKIRAWTGWPKAVIEFGPIAETPYARTHIESQTVQINVDNLLLNPNRVLHTVTPFRLRQEAVLTGTMLHEAGHARHSHWLPNGVEVLHSDGTTPTEQTIGLACLMEEPRVEGLMARDADKIGAAGLDWTMRACAAHLMSPSDMTAIDTGEQVMTVLDSWAKRAGRHKAFEHYNKVGIRNWVGDFTNLLRDVIEVHLTAIIADTEDPDVAMIDPVVQGYTVILSLVAMIQNTDDTGPYMLDMARDVLRLLFPETPDEDMPQAGSGCGSAGATDPENGERGEAGASSSTGEATAGSEPGEGGEGGAEAQPEAAEPTEAQNAAAAALAAALSKAEQAADQVTKTEGETKSEEAPPSENTITVRSAGGGSEADMSGSWRNPTKSERGVQKNAERFLRDLIDPSESSRVHLSDAPASTVDGGALAAWKASGGQRDPRFFRRTHRTVEPSPPVKIAILVDVSSSMESLQTPSALLSWALSAAATDLANFAGRGTQVESTLIHWGSKARVIQPAGTMLPGLRTFGCNEGTIAMGAALDLVEEQIPGFFDASEKAENRLLVQFTDWDLYGSKAHTSNMVGRALAAGVNMLTVAPSDYSEWRSDLSSILQANPIQRGASRVIKYQRANPEQVWTEATKMLR